MLLLIIAETTQQAFVGDDASVTERFSAHRPARRHGLLLSLVKRWSPRVDRLLEGQPLVLLRNGVPLPSRMHLERVDDEDILSAAREARGIDRPEKSSAPCSKATAASRSCRAASPDGTLREC